MKQETGRIDLSAKDGEDAEQRARTTPDRTFASRSRVFAVVLPLVVFVAGMWFFVLRRELIATDGDLERAAGPILRVIIPAVLGIAGLYLAFAIWARHSRRRTHRLAASEPGSIALQTGRIPDLVRSIRDAGLDREFEFDARWLPYALSLVGTTSALSVWGGSATDPLRYFEIEWTAIRGITPSNIAEPGRMSRGLLVEYQKTSDSQPVFLPFVIVGRGFGGLFPETFDVLESRASELLDLGQISK